MKNNSILFLAAALALTVSCKPKDNNAAVAAAAQQVPTVAVSTLEEETIPDSQTYSATVKANVVNNIAPQTSGRIEKINVEVGDFVKQGDILAEMDRVQLSQSEFQLANYENEYKRVKALFEKGGVSASDFEGIELQYNVAKNTYENLLKNTILRSPVTGVVSARNYDAQDLYTMGQPIFTVQQISPVKLIVAVSEKEYTKVKAGNKVEIVSEALPGKTFNGRVSLVYPTIDPTTHTVSVEVVVDNKDKVLRPGMYVTAKVVFSVGKTLLCPDVAVLKQQGSSRRTAFVLCQDGTVEMRIVEVGRHIGTSYEILDGLVAGEQVVVKGQSSLRDGVKVDVAK